MKSKATLIIFVIIGLIVTAIEAIYLLKVEAVDSPIASIFSFTFDALSGSGLYTAGQVFYIHTTLDALNLSGFLIVPFGLLAGCCIMHEIPVSGHREPEYFLAQSKLLKKLITGGLQEFPMVDMNTPPAKAVGFKLRLKAVHFA